MPMSEDLPMQQAPQVQWDRVRVRSVIGSRSRSRLCYWRFLGDLLADEVSD